MNPDVLFDGQERRLLCACLNQSGHLPSDVQRHLKEGFSRRVLLIQSNRLAIRRLADESRTEPLSTHECGDLNIHLNSFYFHMRGALDNLAWVLHYTHQLLGSVDEDDLKARARCNLLSVQFLKELRQHDPELASELALHQRWGEDFKQLRDPVAHRIPLYAVPGVAGRTEQAVIERKYKQATNAAKRGQFRKSIAAIREAHKAGRYRPIFAMSGPQGIEVREIHPQVTADHRNFLTVSDLVLHRVIRSAA